MKEAASNKISIGQGPQAALDPISDLLNKTARVLETLVKKKTLQSSRLAQLSQAVLQLSSVQEQDIFIKIVFKPKPSEAETFLLKVLYLIDSAKEGSFKEEQIFQKHRALISDLIQRPETFDNDAFARKISELKEKTRVDRAIDDWLASKEKNRVQASALAKAPTVKTQTGKLKALRLAQAEAEKIKARKERATERAAQKAVAKAQKAEQFKAREEKLFQDKLGRMNFAVRDLFDKAGASKKILSKAVTNLAAILASFSDDQKRLIDPAKEFTDADDQMQKEFLDLVLRQYFIELETANSKKKKVNSKKLIVRVINDVLKNDQFTEFIQEMNKDEARFASINKTVKKSGQKPIKHLVRELEKFKEQHPDFYTKLHLALRKLYKYTASVRALKLNRFREDQCNSAQKLLVKSLSEIFPLINKDRVLRESFESLAKKSGKVALEFRKEIKEFEGSYTLELGIEAHIPFASKTIYLIYLALISHIASIYSHANQENADDMLVEITDHVMGNFLSPNSPKYTYKYQY